jgi:UDP-N-acetylmuramate dehydrogenase
MITAQVKAELAQLASNPVRWDCPLAPLTSFGIGGAATAVIVVEHLSELAVLLTCCDTNRIKHRFIGRGTNLLVADAGFDGVVLLFGKALSEIRVLEETKAGSVRIQVGAGCSLAKLLRWCTDKSFSGLEFASGIPGSLGGAVVMNAGAWAGEIADVLASVTVFSMANGEEIIARKKLDFGYRKWRNQKNTMGEELLVVSAEIVLQKGSKEKIESTCRGYFAKRKKKQPKGLKNAGSFFKNPQGDSAGRLIEAAGLKGVRCGDAMVSPVHANFFVNMGSAKAQDIKDLMRVVTKKVREESGIELQAEVHFL